MKLSAAALVAVCGTAALALLPLAAPPYYAGLMVRFSATPSRCSGSICCSATPDLLSFGHAMFLGFGAYGAAVLSGVLGIKSFELVLLAVMLGAWCDRAADRRRCACAMSASSSAC